MVLFHPRWPPFQVANRGKWSQVSQSYDSGLGQGGGWYEEAQGLTLAEAPLFPELYRRLRAEQEAQSYSRGQAAARPPLGSYPLIFLAAQGSHFLHLRMPAPEGPQRSQSPTPLGRWGQWSPERHRDWSRPDREPVGKSGPVSRQQCWPRPPPSNSSMFLLCPSTQ